jgi:hypothetical protein
MVCTIRFWNPQFSGAHGQGPGLIASASIEMDVKEEGRDGEDDEEDGENGCARWDANVVTDCFLRLIQFYTSFIKDAVSLIYSKTTSLGGKLRECLSECNVLQSISFQHTLLTPSSDVDII